MTKQAKGISHGLASLRQRALDELEVGAIADDVVVIAESAENGGAGAPEEIRTGGDRRLAVVDFSIRRWRLRVWTGVAKAIGHDHPGVLPLSPARSARAAHQARRAGCAGHWIAHHRIYIRSILSEVEHR